MKMKKVVKMHKNIFYNIVKHTKSTSEIFVRLTKIAYYTTMLLKKPVTISCGGRGYDI